MALTVITGAVDAGKSSRCLQLAAETPGAEGIVLVKVMAEGRVVGYDALELAGGRRLPFSRRRGEEPRGWDGSQRVGPYSVSRRGCARASRWFAAGAERLRRRAEAGGAKGGARRDAEAQSRGGPGALFLDEVGPLELGGGGLAPALQRALETAGLCRVYVVVRRSCLQRFLALPGVGSVELIEVP